MQKKRMKRLLAISLSAALLAAAPLNTVWAGENSTPLKSAVNNIADDTNKALAKVQSNEGKEVTDGGITYYDVGLDKGSDENTLLRAAVTSNNNLLNWSQLAYMIYRDNSQSYFSPSDENKTGYYDGARKEPTIFDNRFGKSPSYTDLIKGLSSTDGSYSPSQKKHELREKDICTKVSGLTTARSLKAVKQAAAQSQVDIKPTKIRSSEFYDRCKLPALDDDKDQPVLYTMVSTRDRYGGTFHYAYNTFGLVFYDFKMAVGSGNQCKITSPIDGYVSVKDAIKDQNQIAGFQYVNDDDVAVSNTINYEDEPAVKDISVTTSKESSATNTMSNSTSIGYSQNVNFNFGWGEQDAFHGGFGFDFGFQQVFETAFSKEKTVTEGGSTTDSLSVTIPAHTAVTQTVTTSNKDMNISYDCPMTVTYKVAMFSMCGDYYDDNAAAIWFSTSPYQQRAFMTTFGTDVGGTTSATMNLKNRLKYKNQPGYDQSYSITKGTRRTSGVDKSDWISGLDWDSILTHGAPQSKGATVKAKASDVTDWLSTHNPMSQTGGQISIKAHLSNSTVSKPVPAFALERIKLVDKDQEHLNLKVGDSYCLNNIEVKGYDSDNGPYYGFRSDNGAWEIVDENGKKTDSDLVSIVDGKNGTRKLNAEKAGTLNLKYFIPEDSKNGYQHLDGIKETNDKIQSAIVEVNIAEKPKAVFDGTIEASGEVKANVGETINLETLDSIDVSVYDKKGIELDVPVAWQAKEKASRGIKVGDNRLTATKEGTFHIRAVIDDVYSDWITVTAEQPIAVKAVKTDTSKKASAPATAPRNSGADGDTSLGNVAETLHGALSKTEAAAKGTSKQENNDPTYWAWKNGLLKSIGTSVISEGEPVTREQLMVITYNTAKYLKKDVSTKKDYLADYKGSEKVSEWAKEAVNWAVSKGIVSDDGKNSKTLYPQKTVSDADVAAFLKLCFE